MEFVCIWFLFLATLVSCIMLDMTFRQAYRLGKLHGIKRARASRRITEQRRITRPLRDYFRRYMEAREEFRKNPRNSD